MKILFVIPTLGQGGAQRVLANLANALASQRNIVNGLQSVFDVSIVTFASPDKELHHLPSEDVSVYHTDSFSGSSASIVSLIGCLWRLRRVINRLKPDVVVVFQDIAIFPAIVATAGIDLKLVISERQDTRFYRGAMVRKSLRWLLYRYSYRVVVQTDLIKKQMPVSVQARTVVIPNAAPANLSSLSSKQVSGSRQKLEIVSVGRLEKQKNFCLLIDAAALLLKYSDDWRMTIYGEGSLREDLERQVNELNLSSKINMPGITKDIYDEMANADIFVLPSLYEGFPNVLVEALSVGLPCVGFDDVSGVAELISNNQNGILLGAEGRNASALAQAIAPLMSSEELRGRMGRESLNIARHYDSNTVLRKWIEILV